MGKGICVIIPAYNEGPVLGDVLDALPDAVTIRKKKIPVTVVVVDDGSVDETPNIVYARPHMALVRHVVNRGAGGATRTGLRYAREHGFDYAVTMDADGQHDTKDVIKLAKAVINDKADFIIGSRLVDTTGMPWYRVFGNRGLNVITFLLFGINVSDSQAGLRAFNREALEKITFHSSSFAFCPEMIWSAKLQHLRIAEMPIKAIYTDYSLGKGQRGQSDIMAGLRIVRQLLKRRMMGFLDG